MILNTKIHTLPAAMQIEVLKHFKSTLLAMPETARDHLLSGTDSKLAAKHLVGDVVDAYLDIIEPRIFGTIGKEVEFHGEPYKLNMVKIPKRSPYLDEFTTICKVESLTQRQIERISTSLVNLIDGIPVVSLNEDGSELINAYYNLFSSNHYSYENSFEGFAGNKCVPYLVKLKIIEKLLCIAEIENKVANSLPEPVNNLPGGAFDEFWLANKTLHSALCNLSSKMAKALYKSHMSDPAFINEFKGFAERFFDGNQTGLGKFTPYNDLIPVFLQPDELDKKITPSSSLDILNPAFGLQTNPEAERFKRNRDTAKRFLPECDLNDILHCAEGGCTPTEHRNIDFINTTLNHVVTLDEFININYDLEVDGESYMNDERDLLIELMYDVEEALIRAIRDSDLSDEILVDLGRKIINDTKESKAELNTLVGIYFDYAKPTENFIIELLQDQTLTIHLPTLIKLVYAPSKRFCMDYVIASERRMESINGNVTDPNVANKNAGYTDFNPHSFDLICESSQYLYEVLLTTHIYPALITGGKISNDELSTLLTIGLRYSWLDAADINVFSKAGLKNILVSGGDQLQKVLDNSPTSNEIIIAEMLKSKVSELDEHGIFSRKISRGIL